MSSEQKDDMICVEKITGFAALCRGRQELKEDKAVAAVQGRDGNVNKGGGDRGDEKQADQGFIYEDGGDRTFWDVNGLGSWTQDMVTPFTKDLGCSYQARAIRYPRGEFSCWVDMSLQSKDESGLETTKRQYFRSWAQE